MLLEEGKWYGYISLGVLALTVGIGLVLASFIDWGGLGGLVFVFLVPSIAQFLVSVFLFVSQIRSGIALNRTQWAVYPRGTSMYSIAILLQSIGFLSCIAFLLFLLFARQILEFFDIGRGWWS